MNYLTIRILIASINFGILHMGRGRGVSDAGGIAQLYSKQIIFFFMSLVVAALVDPLPAVALYVGMTTFWIKIGKIHQNIYMEEIKINEPGISIIDRTVKNIKNLRLKILSYSLLYNITFMPAFIVLGLVSIFYNANYIYLILGTLASFFWPFLLIPVSSFKGRWREWAVGEFIIGFYLCLIVCLTFWFTFL